MIVTIPFHKGDADKAASMLDLCSRLEHVTTHQLILIYPHTTGQDVVEKVYNSARKAFAVVKKYPIPHEVPQGWPKGPNRMFATTASLVRNKQDFEAQYTGDYRQQNGAFLWLEPDCTPLHAGWIDRLQAQYLMAQKPFLGTVRPTLIQDVTFNIEGDPESGIKEYLGKRIEGEHMVLVGMYDRQIAHHINWITQAAEGHEAIDAVLQNEICQKDHNGYTRLVKSELVGHGWKTENYRVIQDGETVTIQADSHEDNTGDTVFSVHRRGYTGPCMIHGCKDDSLIAIVEWMNGLRAEAPKWEVTTKDIQVEKISKSETGEAIIEIKKLPEPSSELDELKAQVAQLTSLLQTQVGLPPKPEKKPKKVKSAPKKQLLSDDEIWDFYTNAAKEDSGSAWRKTLQSCQISARQLSGIRKDREKLQPA